MKNNISLIISSIAIITVMLISSCGNNAEQKKSEVANALEDLQKELETLDNTEDIAVNTDIYESKDGNFRINFPVAPKVESQTIPTEVGNMEMITYLYEKSITEAFMVAISDYPTAMIEAGDVNSLLEGAKNGFLGELGLSIVEENNISLGNNPGMYFKASNETYFVVFKDYLVKNRLYQIGIMRDGSFPSDEAINSFINSFELIN